MTDAAVAALAVCKVTNVKPRPQYPEQSIFSDAVYVWPIISVSRRGSIALM